MSDHLTVKEAAAFLRISVSFLNHRRIQGGGPPFLKIGDRVFYSAATLKAWLAAQTWRSTSEYDP